MKFALAAVSAVLLSALVSNVALAETDAAAQAEATAEEAKADVEEVASVDTEREHFHQSPRGPSSPAAAAKEEEAEAVLTEKEIEEETRVSGYAANPYGSLISSYAAQHGVPEGLAHAVVEVESNFRSDATGAAGEIGLMQLKLSTARMMGYDGSAKALYDPETNIKYGMKYLAKAHELGGGSTCGTILRYNAGHAATRMNPVSANYCNKVAAIL